MDEWLVVPFHGFDLVGTEFEFVLSIHLLSVLDVSPLTEHLLMIYMHFSKPTSPQETKRLQWKYRSALTASMRETGRSGFQCLLCDDRDGVIATRSLSES
jgi:hypothetical protein